ncbi:hypothetical protein D3C72_986240 [compost metagenome]
MLGLDAAVVALVGEGGRDDAFFQFLMLIVGIARAQAHVLDAGQGIAQFAAQIDAATLQPDLGHAVPFLAIAAVVVAIVGVAVQFLVMRVAAFELMFVSGQSIAAGLFGIGGAEIAARPDPGGAERRGRGLVVGAVEARFGLIGDLVVVGLASGGLDADGEVPSADGHADHAGLFIVD